MALLDIFRGKQGKNSVNQAESNTMFGQTQLGNNVDLPKSIKNRIPQAEWLDNPEAWDKNVFIKETSNFLYTVYGIGNDQDKHTLAFLAEQIETYIECKRKLAETPIVTKFNGGKTIGPNPYLTVRNNTLKNIIQLMNELGLTPRSRLSDGAQEEDSPVSKFLRGPKG